MSDSKDDVAHVFDQTNGAVERTDDPAPDSAVTSHAGAATGADHPADTGATRGRASAADDGRHRPPETDSEHTFVVDTAGSASETDEVASPSGSMQGHDEARGHGESSAEPVDDASHTGRLADAYAAGPASQVADGRDGATRSVHSEARPLRTDRHDGGATRVDAADVGTERTGDHRPAASHPIAEAYDRGPAAEVGDDAPRHEQGLAALAGDDSIGHVFDQTNGVIDGLDGEADGTAGSDEASAADRDDAGILRSDRG